MPLAYIDPISGTIVLQLIIAAGVGVIAFFRRSIFSLFGLLTGRKKETDSVDEPAPDRDE